MTTQQFNAAAEVHALKQKMLFAQQRRLLRSMLKHHRGEIIALLKEGASFRMVAKWLQQKKHISVSHTTVMRFAKRMPELMATETKPEVDHAQLS